MSTKYRKKLTLEEIARRPESEIDYSDIHELDERFWENAKIVAPRTKVNVSLRLPGDVIEFFKSESPGGYTSRMAAVLAAYVKVHKPH